MTEKSWTEVQALAVKAATGAGVPPSQALAFGAMLPRHLADGGAEAPLSHALSAPSLILALAERAQAMVESASMSPRLVTAREADAGTRALLISWLAALPCQVDITGSADELRVRLNLSEPSSRKRPARLTISDVLFDQMTALAVRAYVPDSDASRASGAGAGAAAMVLD